METNGKPSSDPAAKGRFTVFGQKPPAGVQPEDGRPIADAGEASPATESAPRVRIADAQQVQVEVVDEVSETADDTSQTDGKDDNRGRQKALKDSPIRTKYSPDAKRELRHRRNSGQSSAENLLNIARQYDRSKSAVGDSNLKPTISKASIASVGHMVTASLREVVTSSKDHNVVSAKLLQTLADTSEDELRGTLPPGAMAALSRHWSMQGIKQVCGIDDSAGQSDFHAMREKGMFFCGYQDAAMKKQGLPSLFSTEAALEDISSSDSEDEDREALEARDQKAILRPEDDRLIMLHRVRGEAVMRRAPQEHEAVLDFGESRISVPRGVKENGGQLQKVAVDMNDDGTGNIVITTQTPRRSCNSSEPNSLADVVDLKNLEKQSKKQPNDETHQISRCLTRPPPSFKEWEAWREIQRQKRMESTDDAIRKMRDGPQAETKTAAASARANKEESARTPTDTSQQVIARKAQRNDKEVLVAERISEPRDAAAPPGEDELNRAFLQLSIDPGVVAKAAGREQSKSIMSSEDTMPAVLSKRWILKSSGGKPLRIDFSAAMTVRSAAKPINMSGSFTDDETGSAGSRAMFWGDFFTPLPDKSAFERLKHKILHCCGQEVQRSKLSKACRLRNSQCKSEVSDAASGATNSPMRGRIMVGTDLETKVRRKQCEESHDASGKTGVHAVETANVSTCGSNKDIDGQAELDMKISSAEPSGQEAADAEIEKEWEEIAFRSDELAKEARESRGKAVAQQDALRKPICYKEAVLNWKLSLDKGTVPGQEFVLRLKTMPFDFNDILHYRLLHTMYSKLARCKVCPRIGSHWEVLGFQGTDPHTDLNRSGGLLNVLHMFFCFSHFFEIFKAAYLLSQDDQQHFPLAAVCINITKMVTDELAAGSFSNILDEIGKEAIPIAETTCLIFSGGLHHFYSRWRTQKRTIRDSEQTFKEVRALMCSEPATLLEELDKGSEQATIGAIKANSAQVEFTNLDLVDAKEALLESPDPRRLRHYQAAE
ncbi:unnamed protein product [Symbiodinium sp. KB8]|nr:unnamed protein product [Symbiodinium sp. KB8]